MKNPLRTAAIALPILVLVLLIANTAIKFFTKPTTPPEITPQRPEISSAGNTQAFIEVFQYTGEPFTPPERLPFYLTSAQPNLEEVLAAFAGQFGLTQYDEQRSSWINEDRSTQLSLNKINNQFTYTFTDSSIETTELLPKDRALEVGQRFLIQLSIPSTIQPNESAIEYFSTGGFELIETGPENATLLKIPFSFRVGAQDVFFENAPTPAATVWVGSPGVIKKAEFFLFPQQIQKQTENITYTVDQALQNMRDGNYAVTSFLMEGSTLLSLNELRSATFSKVRIEHRYSPAKSIILPYYRFEGNAITEDGRLATVTVITPAIPTTSTSPEAEN